MSSPGYRPLHLHAHPKRPFESMSSGPSTRCEARHKRARSTSTDGSSSHPSSSSGYSTAPDAPPAAQDVHMSDLPVPLAPTQPQPTPPTPEDSLRTSLQRFAEFDRQIAALRTSLAATRSPALPTMDGDWQPALSSGTSGPASSTVAVAPTEPSSTDAPPPSTASARLPSTSFSPSYGNIPRYPAYRPSIGGSSSPAVHDRVGEPPTASSTPPFMRPSSNDNTRIRSAVSVDASHPRHPRRSLSPLVFPPDPSSSQSSVVTDDVLLRYRPLYGDGGPSSTRSHRRTPESPIPSLDREVSSRLGDHLTEPGVSPSRFSRVIREHSLERDAVPSVFDVFNIGDPSQDRNRPAPAAPRYADPVPPRVPPSHSDRSRGPAPITTTANAHPVPSQDIPTRVHTAWTSIPSSNSLMSESASERRHALALERFRARLRRSSVDAGDESESRWSASSRGERGDVGVVSPVPPSPSVESVPGTGTRTHVPPPSTTSRADPVASTSTSVQRSFSELFAESQGEDGTETWLYDWDASRGADRERQRERERQLDRERQRERVWEWERQREQSSQDVRGRNFGSGTSLGATRDDPPMPPRPSLGPLGSSTMTSNPTTTTTANNGQPYSYSNLNLASFHSGLFRDSLRRNVEVDQASFSQSGPVIPPPTSAAGSRTASRFSLGDSESEMDFDDLFETRPPSPEWTRPHPYAGRTPPPDYSPPALNVDTRASLRRGGTDRPQHAHRNSAVFTRPMPPAPTRPTPYENNNHPPAQPERTERDRFLPTRILETFYRSHEDGRRNASASAYHAPATRHDVRTASGTGNGNSSRPGSDGVGEPRRGALGLGGSLRSRLARFANPQLAASGMDAGSSRPRSPPRPIGARPQVAEQRRRGSMVFGNPSAFEHDAVARTETRSVSGPPHWSVNAEPAVVRDAPWRTSSGSRSVFTAPPPPPPVAAHGPPRAEMVEVASRVEEHRSRLRTLRQRLQLDRGNDMVRVFRPGMLRGRRGNMGDYVPDELFDDSYEALLSLSSMLGEVRSRATPEEVIASLPTGTFKEWKKEDSETRCPICLDDYAPMDVLTKLIECPHWLHKSCLEQWLRTANTCPVCREKVKASPKPAPARRRPIRDLSTPSETHPSASNGPSRPTQTNTARPATFAGMVFDRVMNDGTTESWPYPTPVQPPTRDARRVYLGRVLAQPRDVPQPVFVEPLPQELPYHFRVPPTGPPGWSSTASHPTAGAEDGLGVRPFGFVPLMRSQGSDSSMSSNASSGASMVVDEVGAGPSQRRSVVGTGTPGGSTGSLFDVPAVMPRRENAFTFVPTFTGGHPPPPPPVIPQPPPPPQQQQASVDVHAAPTMVTSEPGREWRPTRGYDVVFNMDGSRAASSSAGPQPQPRPVSVVNRIPIDEDGPMDEYVFGWRTRFGYGGGGS